jgi:anti-sigma regulatory factor (Ser/Thr protein kinase)
MSTDRSRATTADPTFRHDALFYAGDQGFVASVAPLISRAIDADEAMLVVVSPEKIDLLRSEVGAVPDAVAFADMTGVGQNPARLLPLWSEFAAEHAGDVSAFRGIGEPVWNERSQAELAECSRHEALLNLAFAEPPATWSLLCPYDRGTLPRAVLDEAERNHPHLVDDGIRRPSAAYRGLDDVEQPFDDPLSEPAVAARVVRFGPGPESLRSVRLDVIEMAHTFELDPARTADLVLVVNEVTTNSVRHGGGSGLLRIWVEGGTLLFEVRDAGVIEDPFAGRARPLADRGSGFGLWLANQLCDLVQIRSGDDGSTIRMHVRR